MVIPVAAQIRKHLGSRCRWLSRIVVGERVISGLNALAHRAVLCFVTEQVDQQGQTRHFLGIF
eukprot:scaffold1803_cov92-Amphora_coffeaeformis.AAC.10